MRISEDCYEKEYCVISHTHWDREWYFTFEQFRFRLVKLIDNLLDIMEKEENFVFHLDAQTIVLEDYLKIKPQNKFLLEKYIKEGQNYSRSVVYIRTISI